MENEQLEKAKKARRMAIYLLIAFILMGTCREYCFSLTGTAEEILLMLEEAAVVLLIVNWMFQHSRVWAVKHEAISEKEFASRRNNELIVGLPVCLLGSALICWIVGALFDRPLLDSLWMAVIVSGVVMLSSWCELFWLKRLGKVAEGIVIK